MRARNLLSVRETVDQDNFDMMKNLYSSCMDEKTIKSLGAKPLISFLEDFAKVLPVDDAALTANTTVSAADTKAVGDASIWLGKLGISPIEFYGPGVDDKNPVCRAPRFGWMICD